VEAATLIERQRQDDIFRVGRDMLWILATAEGPGGPAGAARLYRKLAADTKQFVPLGPELLLFLGQRDEAAVRARELRHHLNRWPTVWAKEFSGRIFDYVAGQTDEEGLLAAAGRSRLNRSLAHYAIAMKRLAEGNRSGVRDQFRAMVATRFMLTDAYDFALSFLVRMDRDPSWPPWISTGP
jgi:hypothetical protein